MSCFSSTFIPAIGSSSSSSDGSAARARRARRASAARKAGAHRRLADVLDLEKIDDRLDLFALRVLLASARARSTTPAR
jgi:hypothetical protein